MPPSTLFEPFFEKAIILPGKSLENHRNCVMKLVKDFGLGIDAYPLAYVVFKIAGGDYEVATKMILEGRLSTCTRPCQCFDIERKRKRERKRSDDRRRLLVRNRLIAFFYDPLFFSS